MSDTNTPPRPVRPRDLLVMRDPELWSKWPFLPVVRPSPDGGEAELGVLYDARHVSGTYGFSATVFLVNLFLLPPTLDEFLALPRETFDTSEELADAGWTVD